MYKKNENKSNVVTETKSLTKDVALSVVDKKAENRTKSFSDFIGCYESAITSLEKAIVIAKNNSDIKDDRITRTELIIESYLEKTLRATKKIFGAYGLKELKEKDAADKKEKARAKKIAKLSALIDEAEKLKKQEKSNI